MALIKVNPNRMEVLRLRKRLTLSRRGHKLLKQKQDELMKILARLIRQAEGLREKVEEKISLSYGLLLLSEASSDEKILRNISRFQNPEFEITSSAKRLLNLTVQELKIEFKQDFYRYGFLHTNSDLDAALSVLHDLIPMLIRLYEIETWISAVAGEIEKTRRRVNALEYILIPELEKTVKTIIMKLEEIERGSRVRLMKVKELAKS